MPVERGGDAAVPAGIRALRQRLGGLETEAGRLAGLALASRSDDVFIATSPKCGTTWVQQIVHSLRTRGDLDFDEISCVVPCLEFSETLGIPLDVDQVARPRAFKTHCWYEHCPKGGRYIVVARDPTDVAVSFYKFFEGWFFAPGEVGLDDFVRHFFLARGRPTSRMENASYWDFYQSWWDNRGRHPTLWLFFEDLKADLPGAVRRIADFLGLGDDAAAVAAAVEQASFASMKARVTQYDEHVMKAKRNAACGLAPDAGMANAKVREGGQGAGRGALSAETLAAIDARWAQLAESTGYASYAQWRAAEGAATS